MPYIISFLLDSFHFIQVWAKIIKLAIDKSEFLVIV